MQQYLPHQQLGRLSFNRHLRRLLMPSGEPNLVDLNSSQSDQLKKKVN